jgi:branched-chain amino acid transport system ATP-binding protein
VVPYGLLMAVGNRLLSFMLFGAPLLSVTGYAAAALVLMALAALSHRLTFVRKMVDQYPWLYQRHGLFQWRAKG